MRKTIIENIWIKENKICHVHWIFEGNQRPYIAISGYNPFPFFTTEQMKDSRLYSSVCVFNKWMQENGWKQRVICTNIVKKCIIRIE